MWVCLIYVTGSLLVIYSNVMEEMKGTFPSSSLLSAMEQIWFMFCLFRILKCANTIEYCPRWVTFAQRIYSLSVVMMARHTTTHACSAMKTCKYTSRTIISSSVEALVYSVSHGSDMDSDLRHAAIRWLIITVQITFCDHQYLK